MNLPSPHPGKHPGQKYKSLLVLQYLLKNADDENAVTMSDILSHLSKYDITSDRCPPELQRGYTRKACEFRIVRLNGTTPCSGDDPSPSSPGEGLATF